MARYYYQDTVENFRSHDASFILGELTKYHEFKLEEQQRNAWQAQIRYLKSWLSGIEGNIIFEYTIPRMGRRIDCVLLSRGVVFAIEFKIGASVYDAASVEQVTDYALDLKNFHERSHDRIIVPILICTGATTLSVTPYLSTDRVAKAILTNGNRFAELVQQFCADCSDDNIDTTEWIEAIYKPTPTIIEAAQALYRGHSVQEISRSDAGAINLSRTALAISQIIEESKREQKKSICFLTGVPGAGKTLAGLNLANTWQNGDESEHAVFLSGNGPLVDVLREALARNEVVMGRELGLTLKKSATTSKAKAFIQNIHHFRSCNSACCIGGGFRRKLLS